MHKLYMPRLTPEDATIRLALYDADNLTFSDDSFVSISELREFMSLKQFDLSGSSFELRDTSTNILGLLKSNASDKSDILDAAKGLKLTDSSATTFSVDDVSLLLGKNVAMPNGYKVSDIASKSREVTADKHRCFVGCEAVTVTDRNSNALTLSVENIRRSPSNTQLTATHKIVDDAAAIEAAVGRCNGPIRREFD